MVNYNAVQSQTVNSQSRAPINSASARQDYVTELLVSKYCPDYLNLLLSMLSYQASHSGGRWITWVSSERLTKQQFTGFAIDLTRVRFVTGNSTEEVHQLAQKALAAGNSHCVVVEQDAFSDDHKQALSTVAAAGNSMAMLVSNRANH